MAQLTLTASADLISAHDALKSRGAGYFARDDGHLFLHTGPDALDLLHRITTNSLLDLKPGSAKRTVLTSEIGRVIDVVWVVMLKNDELLVVSDSADHTQTQRGILKYTIIEEACLHDLMNSHGRLTLIGHRVIDVLEKLDFEIDDVVNLNAVETVRMKDDSENRAVAFRSDALGVASWEIVAERDRIYRTVSELETHDLPRLPGDLLHSIRLDNRVPWPGIELNGRVNPLEAGIGHLVDFDKGCYVGQEVIARLDSYDKVQRKLVEVEPILDDESVSEIEAGIDLFAEGSTRSVGWVTSVGFSIDARSIMGLAFVRKSHSNPGSRLFTSAGTQFKVVA